MERKSWKKRIPDATVDGVWGETELLFPFAVYEAKKKELHYQQAEDQIYHACRTYLAMLDDLARNPNNVAEYQTEESSKYQLFAFASCGAYWQVFVVWNMLHDCVSFPCSTIWVFSPAVVAALINRY